MNKPRLDKKDKKTIQMNVRVSPKEMEALLKIHSVPSKAIHKLIADANRSSENS